MPLPDVEGLVADPSDPAFAWQVIDRRLMAWIALVDEATGAVEWLGPKVPVRELHDLCEISLLGSARPRWLSDTIVEELTAGRLHKFADWPREVQQVVARVFDRAVRHGVLPAAPPWRDHLVTVAGVGSGRDYAWFRSSAAVPVPPEMSD